jgi:hypothetical protein
MTTTYTTVNNYDQNGQTIKQYTNNQGKCQSDCNSGKNCVGMVTNHSNCWTVKGFPKPYYKNGSKTYKKNPRTNNIDGYTTLVGKDQNGQIINRFIQYNNDDEYITQCIADCNLNNSCKAALINGSNCWTLNGLSSPYNNPGSTTYKKIVYPTPEMSSNNFPTSANNNNMFSSVFCNNISTNNGFIQKENSTFNNLAVYKTESTPDENTCLNNCKNDGYCSSYNFKKNNSSSNCLLYNQVPSSVSNNDISSNVGYKNNYNYDFNNLNSSQKNVIRNDCINNYLNDNYDTNNLNYTSYFSLANNNSQINFNPQYLANLYEPLGKVKIKKNFTNIDNNLIDSTTDQELNNFANNYNGYLQKQIASINSSNNNNINSDYNVNINYIIDKEKEIANNNLLEGKSATSQTIIQSINGDQNENFENYIIESKVNNKSNIFKFYIFIFIVLIVLYIVYYLKKNK